MLIYTNLIKLICEKIEAIMANRAIQQPLWSCLSETSLATSHTKKKRVGCQEEQLVMIDYICIILCMCISLHP